MENTESVIGIFDMMRDMVVIGGLLGLAGLAVWMLPWSDADLDNVQGELRSFGQRLKGKPPAGPRVGVPASKLAA
jgi:hypothetical protein